jgi:hypothetical protein
MVAREVDRGPLTRSKKTRETKEETKISNIRAKEFTKEEKVAAIRAEKDQGRWQETRVAVVKVVVNTDESIIRSLLSLN